MCYNFLCFDSIENLFDLWVFLKTLLDFLYLFWDIGNLVSIFFFYVWNILDYFMKYCDFLVIF